MTLAAYGTPRDNATNADQNYWLKEFKQQT